MTKKTLIRSVEAATLTAVAAIALLSSTPAARADDVTCTDNTATAACTSTANYLDGLVSLGLAGAASDAVSVTLNSGTIAPVNQFGLLAQSQGAVPGGAGNNATVTNNGTITGTGTNGGGMSVLSIGGDGDDDNSAASGGTATAINNGTITNTGDTVVGIHATSQAARSRSRSSAPAMRAMPEPSRSPTICRSPPTATRQVRSTPRRKAETISASPAPRVMAVSSISTMAAVSRRWARIRR